ncbi:hypothetical protein BRD22_09020 [Halobacteriales archaeon SW_8_68_21]|nr:MAG: hypothetical protein BRD22_09020 [Halobacteriales archaeon SW_8_68_21]
MRSSRTDDRAEDAPTDGTGDRAGRPSYPTRGGIDVLDSLLLRQPIAEGEREAVRSLLADWADDHRDGDARALLPVDGVTLVTLFLDDGEFGRTGDADRDLERGNALLWYVEVVDAGVDAWRTPDATVRDASPLFEAGLAELLTGAAMVHAGDRAGHRHAVHVTNPDRRARYADAVGRPLIAPVAGDELPIPVAIVSLALKPGATSALVARALDIVNRLKQFDRVQSWARGETETVEAEAMYTESLLLEAVGDRQVVHYYMETEDMDRLYEAFSDSDDWEARFSKWLFRRVLADPATFLEPPLNSDCEVLVHAVDPDRP